MKILVINGPNLNFLGIREPDIYGDKTYKNLCDLIKSEARSKNINVEIFQSNHEGVIVDKIQEAYYKKIDGIIINPAAYTHTSVAILDALKSVNIPCVEVHFSNIHGRDEFRTKSVIAPVCKGQIAGFGKYSYCLAIDALLNVKEYNHE